MNIEERPLINRESNEAKILISEITNNYHIKKAILVYNNNFEYIKNFEGVTHAQRELIINQDIIKKYALLNRPYKGYIFSYERLSDQFYYNNNNKVSD